MFQLLLVTLMTLELPLGQSSRISAPLLMAVTIGTEAVVAEAVGLEVGGGMTGEGLDDGGGLAGGVAGAAGVPPV